MAAAEANNKDREVRAVKARIRDLDCSARQHQRALTITSTMAIFEDRLVLQDTLDKIRMRLAAGKVAEAQVPQGGGCFHL